MPVLPLRIPAAIWFSSASFLALAAAAEPPAFTTPVLAPANGADTWTATDALGRRVTDHAPAPRPDRYVGMFYFIWLGAHGYDRASGSTDQSVQPPQATDITSPYDLSRILAANPAEPAYGPVRAFHHWGEPYLGYYVSNDEWVIRKHAQLLADAGVDVIFFDVTNSRLYLPTVLKVAEVFAALRAEGRSTPALSFLLHKGIPKVATQLHEEFFLKNIHRDLWFVWKGKPLILANPAELTPEQREFFSVRESWAWTTGKQGAWFGDGRDKWPWIDHHPQTPGWHESPAQPEELPVAVAQHPVNNIGRSFHDRQQPPPGQEQSGLGLHFAEQWERALAVDPELVFVTGWNEWVAMRLTDGRAQFMTGRPVAQGETFFVDTYSPEFSRDIEPVRGGFTDNYYYQLVSYIRRFKGARAAPRDSSPAAITIDGNFADWDGVTATYHDDVDDITPRDHYGWGRIGRYENHSGRHDLVRAQVAADAAHVYFRLETRAPLGSATLPSGLCLWLRTVAGNFVINGSATGDWHPVAADLVALHGNGVELSVPRAALGLATTPLTLEFKWTDNCAYGADPLHAYDQGDAAPDGRFFYRYTFQP